LSATRASLANAMKDISPRGQTLNGRRMLVVTEVALAVVLLAGSGLMIRSLTKLLSIDTGFEARNVLTVRLTIPPGSLARDSQPEFYSQMLARLRAVPGVAEVGIANCPPLNAGCNGTKARFMDRGEMTFDEMPNTGIHFTSPAWFSTMKIPVKAGRVFTDADGLSAPKVIVINEIAAKKWFPNENPVGKRIAVFQGGFDKGAEIIGVVGGVRQYVDSAPSADAYVSYAQSPRAGMMIFLRTQRDPASIGADVRRALKEIAPRFPVYDMQTMTDRAAAATAPARFSAMLLGLFALTALSLAIVGIYGVMSLVVTARTREIGIRIALGADQQRVQRLVIGEGVSLVAGGAAIGLVGALICTRVLQTLLFDLTPSDPITYVSIVVLLGTTAFAASWIPARKASRVDPVEALRAD
jgi:predicted permease